MPDRGETELRFHGPRLVVLGKPPGALQDAPERPAGPHGCTGHTRPVPMSPGAYCSAPKAKDPRAGRRRRQKSAAGFTATAGRAGDTSIPSATPRISPLLAFMPTKAANAMTKMGMMILNICCLHSEMPKRIMPLRRQANRLFPNAAEGPAGGYCHSRPKSVRERRCGDTGQASPPFGKALPSAALPLHARFLVERGAMAGGEILIGKHMLLRALMLDAVAGARRAEPGGSGHVKAVQEAP